MFDLNALPSVPVKIVRFLFVMVVLMTFGCESRVPVNKVHVPPPLPPRMRGCNAPIASLDAELIERLARWGCNTLRINVKTDGIGRKNATEKAVSSPTNENPLAPYERNLALLDGILPACRKHHINLIISMSGIYGRKLDVFWEEVDGGDYRDHLADFWRAFAQRYKNEPTIIAYDVFNEPNYKADQAISWYDDMLPKAVAAIRSVNPCIWLIVEPGPWGLPNGFKIMPPRKDPYIIYSFHHYAPHNYTHQGVGKKRRATRGKLSYPGVSRMFDSKPEFHWDKNALRQSMQAAIDFAKTHNVRILVGEFGVIRWAPGGDRWLADSIDVFEEEGFDWLFHSPSGWNGWNPTFGPDDKPAGLSGAKSDGGKVTNKLKVLLNGWARNRRPLIKGERK